MAGVNGWQQRQSNSDAMVGGAAAPSTNNTSTPPAASSGNFLQSFFSQAPQPAQPVATPQQIYGGGGEQNDATPAQIFGTAPSAPFINNLTPQQIFGGGGEENDATPQQIFGGTPSSTPEVSTGPSAVVDSDKGSASNPPPNPTQGTQATATSPAVQNATQVGPAGVTPAAFSDLLNNALSPNPLNAYFQSTYHFRLFMIGDQDVVSQAGNPTTSSALLTALSSRKVKQITVAESGVTGYSITDVQINTLMAQNGATASQAATTISMTITEPLGVSFLDGLIGAATTLGIFDYTKVFYYLELTFTGYTEQGQYAKRPIPMPADFLNGGVWIWQLVPTTIQTKVNEGGGVYSLNFITPDHAVSCDTKKLALPSTLTIKGKTLGDLFDAYVTEVNKAWTAEYSATGKQIRSLKIITRPITMGPYAGTDIRTFKLTSQSPDISSARLKALDAANMTQAQLSPGTSINAFITSAINSTEEGQKILKDEPALGNTSQTSSQVNDRKFREMTTFSVELLPKPVDKDPVSGNYVTEWDAVIQPYYTQKPIVDPTQVQNASDPSVQRQMIAALIKNGQIKKRYDYMFTGNNTEVIDFNIQFDMTWNVQMAKLAGARLNYNNLAVQAALGPIQKAQSDTKPQAAVNLNIAPTSITGQSSQSTSPSSSSQVDPGPTSTTPTPAAVASTTSHIGSEAAFQNTPQSLTVTGSQNNPVAQATQAVLDGVQNPSAAVQNMLSGVVKANNAANPTAQASQPRLSNTSGTTPSEASSNLYIEDLINAVNQPATHKGPPISFWQTYKTSEHAAGQGFTGEWGRDQSVVGAIFSQIYDCPLTSSFFHLDPLTIRGDPYWLGQTNLARLIDATSNTTSSLPNPFNCRAILYLYFKYPTQMGDDFKPVLAPSQSFNGLYEVSEIKHTFSDGAFKQELKGQLYPLHDMAAAMSGGGTGSGAGSSQQLAGAGGGGNSAPGSSGGITAAQKAAFVATYGPLAVQAGQTLGVSPDVILGQWAFESGYGTSRAATQQGNVAGINVPGGNGQQYASFDTPQDFATAYTTLLQNPRYSQASNTGTNASAFIYGLKSGGYFTSDPASYAAGVASIAGSHLATGQSTP